MLFRSLCIAPLVAAAAITLLPLAPARADQFIDQANASYRTIRPDRRSDLVLLPALMKIQPPPASAADPRRAALLPAGASGWDAAEQWAKAAPQRAVLDALANVTSESGEPMAFGQPYGADAVATIPGGIDVIKANLYTDLGAPPMLAAARFLYIPALDEMVSLVNVEATRLAAAGNANDAINLLTNLVYFARQMADREMFAECRWGLQTIIVSLDRIRDVAYVDFRSGKPTLDGAKLQTIMERLRPEGGFVRTARITFPTANRIAIEQVIATAFDPRGGPNQTFGQTMAHLASTDRPLRLFAEAARWDKIAAGHADAQETRSQLDTVYNDYAARWNWDPWDPRNTLTTDFEKMDTARFAVIAALMPDMPSLFNDLQVLRTQLVGTKDSLGVLAFFYDARQFPPTLAAIRPRYVKSLEADPYNFDRANHKEPPLEYFVPIRDETFAAGEDPHPHEMNILTRGGEQNFQVHLDRDQFVLYSVGPNGVKDQARNVYGAPQKDSDGDLLLWPPVTSLVRQRLMESGALK
jgi:hypothetical protein